MSIVKVYCGQCGQRVSGDESFYGTVHRCPICSASIRFPDAPPAPPAAPVPPPPPAPPEVSSLPRAVADPEPAPNLPPTPAPAEMPRTPPAPAASPEPGPDPKPPSPAPPAERDQMPLYVLGAGIASLIPCLGIMAAPVAIVLGHLTLLRMDEELPPAERNKLLLGTCLGYVSLLFLLIFALVWKFKGPAISAAFSGD